MAGGGAGEGAGSCDFEQVIVHIKGHTIHGMIQIGGFELMTKELRFNEQSGCMGPLQVPRILTF